MSPSASTSHIIAESLTELSLRDRRAAAAALRGQKNAMATRANDAFLAHHPDWHARFGDAAIRRGVEDATFHIEFLAGALEVGEVSAFVDYVSWLMEVLGTRGIDGSSIAESLTLIGVEAQAVTSEVARETLGRIVQAGVARATAGDTAAREYGDDALAPFGPANPTFVHAILQGKRQGALGIAREALRVARHPTDVYVGLFQQSLEDIGRRWQQNRITVAQEHMATATVQFVLAQVYSSLDRSAPTRGTALVTGVEGELHQVGANLVADALELDGWRVRFLGTNMPHDGIVAAAAEMKADLIGISATMLFNVGPVAKLVESVRAAAGVRPPRILVGGGAFRSAPRLWKEIGADGFAPNVRDACAIARVEVATR